MQRQHGSPIRRVALLLAGSFCFVIATQAQQTFQVALDGTSPGKTFEGLGALSAGASSRLLVDYPEPYRSQILDYLFKPNFGASLQHLKVEIGSDVNSTDGSEPSHMRSRTDHDYSRGYEWWLMTEARKRNPKIILDTLPWGAPGWIGNGVLYSPDMANYTVDFLKGARRTYGLDIAYTGIWNERVYDAAYVKILHKALLAGASRTKLVCCDEYVGEGAGQWAITDAMAKDPELEKAVDVVGVHYPQENGKLTTTESARASGKHLWSSEDQPNSGGGPILSRDWPIGGRILATVYNRNYLEGGMTKTEIWSPITSYYDILAAPNSGLMYANTPWSGNYDVQSTIWVTAHTTQFAQPGWKYLDRSSGHLPGGGTYVSLKSGSSKDWSMVVETVDAKASQAVKFTVGQGLSGGAVHVWETNGSKSFIKVADIQPSNSTFSYSFEPNSIYSLTTTTGQRKGTAVPPPPKAFPFPYKDNFDLLPAGHAARYLSDQDGAFEAHDCTRRAGKCLQQVITQKPIPWSPIPDPFTLAGDVHWDNYEVASDVHFIDPGPVTVMGRIDSADVFQDAKALWPSGYVFSVEPSGSWKLFSTAFKKPITTLASGRVQLDGAAWHSIEVGFHGNTISADIDHKTVASVQDASHSHGMFALGSGWQRAEFDNLIVEAK